MTGGPTAAQHLRGLALLRRVRGRIEENRLPAVPAGLPSVP
ncbi:hypothetical protein AB0J28_41300 [Streptosporangium canum]